MSNSKLSFLISISLHILLVVFSLLYYFSPVSKKISNQIEIMEFRMENISSAPQQQLSPNKFIGEPEVSENQTGKKSNPIPSKVDLPESYIEHDEPFNKFEVPEHKEIALNDLDLNDKIGNSFEASESKLAQDGLTNQETELKDQPASFEMDEYLSSLSNTISEGESTDSPYLLEGEIIKRKILTKIVPEYPAQLQKNATVKIKFEVLPNGNVINLLVIKKDDPLLEEISLNSLKNWRFNPIPGETIQKGSITFIYQLK